MTVTELIEKLEEMPKDMELLNYEYFDICDVYIEEPYHNGEKFVIIN